MTTALNHAAVALAQLIIKSEYAVRITQLTSWVSIPRHYRGACTIENHGFFYSFWFAGEHVLVRVEGLGIFQAEFADEEPPVVSAVLYHLPTPLPQAA